MTSFFGRIVSEVVRLPVGPQPTEARRTGSISGCVPKGSAAPLARSLASTLSYYDTIGRNLGTAGTYQIADPPPATSNLAPSFWKRLSPFVYRKYLSFAEINEIKSIKRRIEQKASQGGVSDTEVKTGTRRHPRHRVYHPVSPTAQRPAIYLSCASATPSPRCKPWRASAV